MPPTQEHDEKEKRDDVVAKIDREVVRVAKIVAEYRGVSLAHYLSERLRPLVDADHDQEMDAEKARKKSRRVPVPGPHASRKSSASTGE